MAEKCSKCGYERPDADVRARRFGENLNRENPMQYPLQDALELGRKFAAAPNQNCAACGATFVAAVEAVDNLKALDERVAVLEAARVAPAPVVVQ